MAKSNARYLSVQAIIIEAQSSRVFEVAGRRAWEFLPKKDPFQKEYR
jgi:hypothetical protein